MLLLGCMLTAIISSISPSSLLKSICLLCYSSISEASVNSLIVAITPVTTYSTHSVSSRRLITYRWRPCPVLGSVLVTDVPKFSHVPLRAAWYSDEENLCVGNYKNKFYRASWWRSDQFLSKCACLSAMWLCYLPSPPPPPPPFIRTSHLRWKWYLVNCVARVSRDSGLSTFTLLECWSETSM